MYIKVELPFPLHDWVLLRMGVTKKEIKWEAWWEDGMEKLS